jgi:hypothetical protein
MHTAEMMLGQLGIKTNIETAKISRVDAFKNVVASEPFSCYQSVLGLLKGSRMKQRGYENGVLWENKQHELCVYDKLQKMRHDKLPVVGLPENTMRFETRMLSARKVRDALAFSSVKDFLDGYDRVEQVYLETMEKTLFKYSASEVEVLFASEVEADMMFYKEHYGRNHLQLYILHFGFHSLMQKMNRETFLDIVDKVADNKMQKSRIKRELHKMDFSTNVLTLGHGTTRTNGELYNELRDKVLAV